MKTLSEYYYDIKFEIVGKKMAWDLRKRLEKRELLFRGSSSVLYVDREEFYTRPIDLTTNKTMDMLK